MEYALFSRAHTTNWLLFFSLVKLLTAEREFTSIDSISVLFCFSHTRPPWNAYVRKNFVDRTIIFFVIMDACSAVIFIHTYALNVIFRWVWICSFLESNEDNWHNRPELSFIQPVCVCVFIVFKSEPKRKCVFTKHSRRPYMTHCLYGKYGNEATIFIVCARGIGVCVRCCLDINKRCGFNFNQF